MTHDIQLYWSFRSPYSHLGTKRYIQLEADYDVKIDLRIVYPLAIRNPAFFGESMNPNWLSYLLMDVMRIAQMQGLDMGFPNPDPVVQDLQTREIASEQPYIYRLCRLGVAASEAGRGLAFIDEVSQLIWGGKQRWDEGDLLARATERAGLDLAQLDVLIEADPDGYDAKLAANQQALEAAGAWGVPTAVLNAEPFWGQDRIDVLRWRLDQLSAKRTL